MKRNILVGMASILLFGFSSWAESKSVYVISGGDSIQDDRIETVLEGFGHSVTVGVEYTEFDGSLNLSGYDVVLFLLSSNWGLDMPEAGQSNLVDFVKSGNGLVTGEWVLWAWFTSSLQILYEALPATTSGAWNYATPITYRTCRPHPVINNGVASPFTFEVSSYAGTESDVWPKPGAYTFYTSSNYSSGLVGWSSGTGRVLNFSTPIGPDELENANYRRLLSNAMDWAGGDGRAVPNGFLAPVISLLLDP
jgi:hypothetical protein